MRLPVDDEGKEVAGHEGFEEVPRLSTSYELEVTLLATHEVVDLQREDLLIDITVAVTGTGADEDDEVVADGDLFRTLGRC